MMRSEISLGAARTAMTLTHLKESFGLLCAARDDVTAKYLTSNVLRLHFYIGLERSLIAWSAQLTEFAPDSHTRCIIKFVQPTVNNFYQMAEKTGYNSSKLAQRCET